MLRNYRFILYSRSNIRKKLFKTTVLVVLGAFLFNTAFIDVSLAASLLRPTSVKENAAVQEKLLTSLGESTAPADFKPGVAEGHIGNETVNYFADPNEAEAAAETEASPVNKFLTSRQRNNLYRSNNNHLSPEPITIYFPEVDNEVTFGGDEILILIANGNSVEELAEELDNGLTFNQIALRINSIISRFDEAFVKVDTLEGARKVYFKKVEEQLKEDGYSEMVSYLAARSKSPSRVAEGIKLNPLQEKILKLIKTTPGLPLVRISQALQIPKNTARDNVRRLKKSRIAEIVEFPNQKRVYIKGEEPRIPLTTTQEVIFTVAKAVPAGVKIITLRNKMGLSETAMTRNIARLKELNLVEVKTRGRELWLYARGQAPTLLITARQNKVLEKVMAKNGLSVEEIAAETGVHRNTVKWSIDALGKKDLLETRTVGNELKVYIKGRAPVLTITQPQEKILETVRETAGLSQRAISVATGLSEAVVSDNLGTLKKRNLVETKKDGNTVRVYAAGQMPEVILNSLQTRIVNAVKADPGLIEREISERTDIPRTTVTRHIKILKDKGVLRTEGEWNKVRVYLAEKEAKEPSLGGTIGGSQTATLSTANIRPGVAQGRIGNTTYNYLADGTGPMVDTQPVKVIFPAQTLAEKLNSLEDKLVLSRSEELGRVINLKAAWSSLNSQEKKEVAAQINSFEPGVSIAENENENMANYLDGDLKKRERRMYALVSPEGKVTGYILYRVESSETAMLMVIETDQVNTVKGRGTFLMDTLISRLRQGGIKELTWVSSPGAEDFYTQYLDSKGIRYAVRGGEDFVAFLNTVRSDFTGAASEVEPSEKLSSAAETLAAKFDGLKDDAVLYQSEALGRVINLRAVWDVLNEGEKQELSEQICSFGWPVGTDIAESVETMKQHLKIQIDGTDDEVYALISSENKVTGYLFYRIDVPGGILVSIETTRKEKVKGRGTILMDAMIEQLRQKGVKKLTWFSTTGLGGAEEFYHKYLRLRDIDYTEATGGYFIVYLSKPDELDKKIIVDVGCGNGRVTGAFAGVPNTYVIGVEPEEEAYKEAVAGTKGLANVKIENKRIQDWVSGEYEGTVDLAYFTFAHPEDLEEQSVEIARNVHRILKEGGRFLIYTDVTLVPLPIYQYANILNKFVRCLEEAGFEVTADRFPSEELPAELKNSVYYGQGTYTPGNYPEKNAIVIEATKKAADEIVMAQEKTSNRSAVPAENLKDGTLPAFNASRNALRTDSVYKESFDDLRAQLQVMKERDELPVDKKVILCSEYLLEYGAVIDLDDVLMELFENRAIKEIILYSRDPVHNQVMRELIEDITGESRAEIDITEKTGEDLNLEGVNEVAELEKLIGLLKAEGINLEDILGVITGVGKDKQAEKLKGFERLSEELKIIVLLPEGPHSLAEACSLLLTHTENFKDIKPLVGENLEEKFKEYKTQLNLYTAS